MPVRRRNIEVGHREKPIVNKQFLVYYDFAQGATEHSAALLLGFAVWLTTVVQPTGRIASLRAVDHLAVTKIKEKRVPVLRSRSNELACSIRGWLRRQSFEQPPTRAHEWARCER
jgi:hypothetical protein